MIKAVVFDFGGVLAEEGFREGLKEIGRKNGLNPDSFFIVASELVYQTGYINGMSDESDYWRAVRKKTGISGDDEDLGEELLERFVLRTEMVRYVEKLKSSGFVVAILSDQTNWLDEINRETPFFHYFHYIFNSFHIGKNKRDATTFRDICLEMGLKPHEVLFIDDNKENIKRASGEGLKVIHFKDVRNFEIEIDDEIRGTGTED
jgi:putative hydrolase of the HAD superfamily